MARRGRTWLGQYSRMFPGRPRMHPSVDPLLDDGSCFLRCRDGILAQAMHDVGVREQVVKSVRVPRSRRAEAKPVRVEMKPLPGRGVTSHVEKLAGACKRRLRQGPLASAPAGPQRLA